MPSTASKQPSGAASTPVTRTSPRCGTGPGAASATTAGAAGGATITTSSPPPSSDQASLGLHARSGLESVGPRLLRGRERAGVYAAQSGATISTGVYGVWASHNASVLSLPP